MTHLTLVPDTLPGAPPPAPGPWTLDLGHHDGTPCPECGTSSIPFAVGVHNGQGRLCTACTATEQPVLADVVEAVDALDVALAFSAIGHPRFLVTTLIAAAVAHVINDRSAEEPA